LQGIFKNKHFFITINNKETRRMSTGNIKTNLHPLNTNPLGENVKSKTPHGVKTSGDSAKTGATENVVSQQSDSILGSIPDSQLRKDSIFVSDGPDRIPESKYDDLKLGLLIRSVFVELERAKDKQKNAAFASVIKKAHEAIALKKQAATADKESKQISAGFEIGIACVTGLGAVAGAGVGLAAANKASTLAGSGTTTITELIKAGKSFHDASSQYGVEGVKIKGNEKDIEEKEAENEKASAEKMANKYKEAYDIGMRALNEVLAADASTSQKIVGNI
jgi:hypothetical protein